MEIKKNEPTAPSKAEEASAVGGGLVKFFGDVKAEFKKISWTSPEELRVYTKIVVASTFFLGMGIYFMDLIIQSFLNGLNLFFHWVF